MEYGNSACPCCIIKIGTGVNKDFGTGFCVIYKGFGTLFCIMLRVTNW